MLNVIFGRVGTIRTPVHVIFRASDGNSKVRYGGHKNVTQLAVDAACVILTFFWLWHGVKVILYYGPHKQIYSFRGVGISFHEVEEMSYKKQIKHRNHHHVYGEECMGKGKYYSFVF